MAPSIEQTWLLILVVTLTLSATSAQDDSTPCPEGCSCPSIPPAVGLVCTGRNLTAIPPVNTSAHFVDLSGNPLTVITNHTLAPIRRAQHLEILVLKACAIRSIEDGAFEQLEELRLVDLSSNGISDLGAGVFSQLAHLSEINLSENNITKMSAHWFAENSVLRVLNLTANPLHHLEAEVFARLVALEELRLDQCSLQSVDAHAFDGLFKLHTLNLSRNHLTSLTPDAITWLKELGTLELTANPWQCDCNIQAITVILLIRGFQQLAGNQSCAVDGNVIRWIDVNSTQADCESQIRMHARKTTLLGTSAQLRNKLRHRLEPVAMFSSHAAAAATYSYSPVTTVGVWCAVIVLLGLGSYLGIYMTSKMCVYATTKAAAVASHTGASRKRSMAAHCESSDCERALVDETAQFRDHFYLVDEASSDISISIDV